MDAAHGEKIDKQVKISLLVTSLFTLGFLLTAYLSENVFADWVQLRSEYSEILTKKATDDRGKSIADLFEVRITQNYVPDLKRVDRCVTCHAGVDDPRMADEKQPFRSHPGKFLSIHTPGKFGCTVCHDGQGRATEVADAHGHVEFWDYPMLPKKLLSSRCTRCHEERDLAGGLYERAMGEKKGNAKLSGAAVAQGQNLIDQKGCLGCHTLNGQGGAIGPNLANVGEKTWHQLDFSHVDKSEERSVINWHKNHFENPAVVSPESVMPPTPPEEVNALTAYMLSLNQKVAAAAYRVPSKAAKSELTGQQLYQRYCSACHGPEGLGRGIPSIVTPALNNIDTLAVASDNFMRRIIAHGRENTKMPAWGEGPNRLTNPEIEKIVAYIRSWEPERGLIEEVNAARGNAKTGHNYYRILCFNCHGAGGEGGLGNALNSHDFLGLASDQFLAETIIKGRPGTGMPSWKHLTSQAVSDVVAYLRSLEPKPPEFKELQSEIALINSSTNYQSPSGALVYKVNCSGCHGRTGEGGIGPKLNSDDFLRAVDDRYLYNTLTKGRPGTAMPAWKNMLPSQMAGLIKHLRSWQSDKTPLTLSTPRIRGDAELGAIHYKTACERCHGVEAVGSVGSQLANKEFLRATTDAQLYQWIAHGRSGSAMRGFLAKAQGPVELSPAQIMNVIAYIRQLGTKRGPMVRREGAGDANYGRGLYIGSCASCHGQDGEGASGPQLNNTAFLKAASDGFLAATIITGRRGTAMKPMIHGSEGVGQLSPKDVQDIVAFIRLWEFGEKWRKPRAVVEVTRRSFLAGSKLYAKFCASCHGAAGLGQQTGDGYHAPALNNKQFLDQASDGFLIATIARGRRGTPMRPFGQGAGGIAELSASEISDIVSFIRAWQKQKKSKLNQR